MITILTPTYNRRHTLSKLYDSLVRQKNKNFEWLVIDDGSKDDTELLMQSFIKQKKIDIKYYKKENGGKHSAINYGIDYIKGQYVAIIDSDDYLVDNAIVLFNKYIKKYDKNNKIGVICFNRCYPDGKTIGRTYDGNEIISNLIDFKFNGGINGDTCELIKIDALKKYRFPIFEGENFMAEAVLMVNIALEYDTVYINKSAVICEYLSDGLTKSMLKNRTRCPKGTIENCKVFLNPRFKPYIRFKNYIMYVGFSKIDKRSFKRVINETNNVFLTVVLYPAGLLFYFYLILKFKK